MNLVYVTNNYVKELEVNKIMAELTCMAIGNGWSDINFTHRLSDMESIESKIARASEVWAFDSLDNIKDDERDLIVKLGIPVVYFERSDLDSDDFARDAESKSSLFNVFSIPYNLKTENILTLYGLEDESNTEVSIKDIKFYESLPVALESTDKDGRSYHLIVVRVPRRRVFDSSNLGEYPAEFIQNVKGGKDIDFKQLDKLYGINDVKVVKMAQVENCQQWTFVKNVYRILDEDFVTVVHGNKFINIRNGEFESFLGGYDL